MTTAIDIDAIFMDCLGTDPDAPRLQKIAVINGYRYATDGRIIVRQKTELPDTKDDYPDIRSVWQANWTFADAPTELPDVVCDPKSRPCGECSGDGIRRCRECESKLECDECSGTGTVWPERKPVRIVAGYALADQYVAILRKYNAVVYLPEPIAFDPSRFTAGDDVDGFVMPIKMGDAK